MAMKKRAMIQTGLRVNEDFYARLAKEADEAGTSLNAELERRLVASFDVDALTELLFELPVEELFRLLKGNARLIALVLRTGDDAAWSRKAIQEKGFITAEGVRVETNPKKKGGK